MTTVTNSDQALAVDVPGRGEPRPAARTGPSELAPRWAKAVAFVAAAGIAVHLLLRFSSAPSAHVRTFADIPLYVTLVAGGLPLVVNLSRRL